MCLCLGCDEYHLNNMVWYEDEDESETDYHIDRDKGGYTVRKYDTTKCIYTYVQGYTHTYVRTHIIA